MTELTDHARSILRAIADGKIIERLLCNIWRLCNVADAGSIIEDGDELKRLRINNGTCSINGVEFAAPVDRADFIFTPEMLDIFEGFTWTCRKNRDTAYQAIVDALEGKTK